MLQIRAQTSDRQYLHVLAEKLLNVLLEGNHIEQRSARLDIDEEIDVAVLMIVPAGDRAEHADVAQAVSCRGVQNFAAVLAEQFKRHAPMIAGDCMPMCLPDRAAILLLLEAADLDQTSGASCEFAPEFANSASGNADEMWVSGTVRNW